MKTAKNYTTVQFVGYVLSTIPALKESVEGMSDWETYLGKEDDTEDINTRLKLISKVLKISISKAVSDNNTLKIFVIPEFFWRGKRGAYQYKNPNKDEIYEKIKNGLEDIIKRCAEEQNDYRFNPSDWLFVFGSVLTTPVSSHIVTDIDKVLAKTGDDFLNVYSLIKKNSNGNSIGSLSRLLRIADKAEVADTTDDEKLSSLLADVLDMSDSLATQTIYNRSLIFYNGQVYNIQKQYKSKEDFILNNPSEDKNQVECYLQTMVNYPSIDSESVVPTLPLSNFTCGNLNIGVKICLDHSRKRLLGYTSKGEIRPLDIQIVPSCGMQLRKDSIVTKEGGLLFNCDGEYTLEGDVQNGDCSHSELKRGQFTASCGPCLSKQLSILEIIPVMNGDICIDELFPHGAGQIHIYNPQSCNTKFK